jgi:hypothetical protein
MLMSIPRFAFVAAVLLASAAAAQPSIAPSEDATGVVLRSTFGEFSGRQSGPIDSVADVRPGETVTITGECVRVSSADDLRVVLTVAGRPDGSVTGYRAVIATDQRMRDGNLQVRVPDLPEAEDHVFQVKVFRLGEQVPQICAAGAIRIDAHPDGKVG